MACMEDIQKLTELRQNIDDIDFQILKLLNKRAKLSLKARIAKGGQNVYRPEREKAVLKHVAARNTGPLSDEAIQTIFTSIIFICRGIQEVTIKKGS